MVTVRTLTWGHSLLGDLGEEGAGRPWQAGCLGSSLPL